MYSATCNPPAMASTTMIETVTITRPLKVIALICGLLVVILMVLGLASADWLMAAGWRQGLFMHCIDPEAPTPLPFDITAQPGCYAARPASYIKAAAGLCVATLAADVCGALLTGLGLRAADHRTKFRYYRFAVLAMALALMCILIALVIYPVCFAAELNLGNRSVWEFGWAYGVGWGAAIFLFGAVVLLLCDKESEELYYKERKMEAEALDQASIILLLDMISKHIKATNARNNELNKEAWKSIAQEYCALTGDFRRAEQLQLKWENLKRSALVRQDNLKMVGEKALIPPEEVLKRVASILGATYTGLSVELGCGGVNAVAVGQVLSEAVVELDFQPLPDITSSSDVVVLGEDGGFDAGGGREIYFTPKNFNKLNKDCNKDLIKQRKLAERAEKDKDLELAAYFQVKAEKIAFKNKKIELENRKLALESKKLELENEKLELEIRQLKQNINC